MAIQGLLDTMASGLAAHNKLLGAALPRVSSEGVMVAIATEALLEHHTTVRQDELPFEAEIETERRDLRITGGNDPYQLEFKSLWPGELGECAGGIKRDLAKLAGVPNAYAIAFAYAFEKVPPGAPYRARGDLGSLLDDATKLVERSPAAHSQVVTIEAHGCRARMQLVAWRAT